MRESYTRETRARCDGDGKYDEHLDARNVFHMRKIDLRLCRIILHRVLKTAFVAPPPQL